MGERVQIARQDTLLEVQTTGIQTNDTLDIVKSKIGDFGDTAEEGTLFGQLAGGGGSSGVVKSVQSGVLNGVGTSDGSGADNVIKINNVNPAKCLVIIQTMRGEYADKTFGMGGFFKSLTSTELTVRVYSNMLVSWQVIEFF